MEALIKFLFLLIPAFICVIFYVAWFKRSIFSRESLVTILASYGIYVVIEGSASIVSSQVQSYMRNACTKLPEMTAAPCPEWKYRLWEFSFEWVFILSMVIALTAHIFFLTYWGRHLTFNNHKQRDGQTLRVQPPLL
jgi:branched-subunit amino acid ABC-type transport system permease component